MADNTENKTEEVLPYRVERSWVIDRVSFNNIEHYLRIKKCDEENTWDQIKLYFIKTVITDVEGEVIPNPDATPLDEVKYLWDTLQPMTALDALSLFRDNAEKRMCALKYVGAKNLVESLQAQVVDTQTITKTQWKTTLIGDYDRHEGSIPPENIKRDQVSYDDTYTLYKIDGKQFNIDNEIFIIHCKCTTTNKDYYLFVDGEDERCNSNALSAIAYTMINPETDEPCSVEEYLALKSEA